MTERGIPKSKTNYRQEEMVGMDNYIDEYDMDQQMDPQQMMEANANEIFNNFYQKKSTQESTEVITRMGQSSYQVSSGGVSNVNSITQLKHQRLGITPAPQYKIHSGQTRSTPSGYQVEVNEGFKRNEPSPREHTS